MQKLREGVKLDMGLYPLTGATSLTGQWFPMAGYRRALFHAMASGQTNGMSFTFAVYEATDASGSDEAILGAAVTFTQGSKISRATVLCATVSVDDTVIITPYSLVGGVLTAGTALTFTAAAAESIPNRQYNQASTDAACAISLAACINDATYGVPGLTASVDTATVTILPTVPGEGVFDLTELAAAVARLVVTDIEQQIWFEVDADELSDGFTHIGCRVASVDATTEIGVSLLRALPRYSQVGQTVAAYDDSE